MTSRRDRYFDYALAKLCFIPLCRRISIVRTEIITQTTICIGSCYPEAADWGGCFQVLIAHLEAGGEVCPENRYLEWTP